MQTRLEALPRRCERERRLADARDPALALHRQHAGVDHRRQALGARHVDVDHRLARRNHGELDPDARRGAPPPRRRRSRRRLVPAAHPGRASASPTRGRLPVREPASRRAPRRRARRASPIRAACARSAKVTPPSGWKTPTSSGSSRSGQRAATSSAESGSWRTPQAASARTFSCRRRPEVETSDTVDQALAARRLELAPRRIGRQRHPHEPLVGIVEPEDPRRPVARPARVPEAELLEQEHRSRIPGERASGRHAGDSGADDDDVGVPSHGADPMRGQAARALLAACDAARDSVRYAFATSVGSPAASAASTAPTASETPASIRSRP